MCMGCQYSVCVPFNSSKCEFKDELIYIACICLGLLGCDEQSSVFVVCSML